MKAKLGVDIFSNICYYIFAGKQSAERKGNKMTITKELEIMQEIDRTNKERIARYLNGQKKG